jgi:hypothetical protein
MSQAADDLEKQLRMELMAVQIEHFKNQIKWEPWKVVAISLGAGAALMGAAVALATAVLRSFGAH